MRYEPSQRLLRLALTLAGTRAGLTLDEIAQELEVGRRTAERLRDSLAGLFPQLEGWDDEERVRRWRLPGGALAGVAEPRAEAVAAVEAVARMGCSNLGASEYLKGQVPGKVGPCHNNPRQPVRVGHRPGWATRVSLPPARVRPG